MLLQSNLLLKAKLEVISIYLNFFLFCLFFYKFYIVSQNFIWDTVWNEEIFFSIEPDVTYGFT